MKTSDFNYQLPEELIAQTPLERRDGSRLMTLDRNTGAWEHHHFYELPDFLNPGDCLILNDSRVLPARLLGQRLPGGGACEVLLLTDKGDGLWECLTRPGKKTRTGVELTFGDGLLTATVEAVQPDGNRLIRFHYEGIFLEILDKLGTMPLPPYIKEKLDEKSGAIEQLEYLFTECNKTEQKIYLFIDEYDHFTNAILSDAESLHRYTEETHKEGYLRAFFNKVKAGTDSCIKRCFITGVSPVTMDDLTSGFNIGTNYSLSPEFNEMTGFTEKEVREMLTYYSTNSPFNHTVGQLIDIMKPWYDNYCFAPECYGETTLYNSNMVLYFVKNYILRGKAPQKMIESNIRIDYEKLRMLIRKDKEFAHDASIIQTLVSQGYITGELKDSFPAANIVDPDNFISLLYYFGMLTISGMHKGKNKLTIPNQVVEEQLYTYLLNTYNEADLSFSSYEKDELASALAYDGNWQAYFGYIADCLKRYASQRDKQKGEFFVHGFTLAMTAQNRFYRPISEADTQEGYADLFLCPLLEIYPDMKHSYIIELKYAKYKDSESRVEELRLEGIAQANRYADSDRVKNAVGTTQLHKIVVVYKGMEMRVCEEIVPLHETYN